jgi:formylglycine-generating enzyme required for sulfatase activity
MESPSRDRESRGKNLTLRRTPRSAQGFIEPKLEVGEAIPLHMVLIPSGTFMMGSPEDEPERESKESPQHEVKIQQFFMARYPVTQAQWRAVAQLPLAKIELDPDPSSFKGANRPVEQVSWFEAEEFCARLKVHTDREYRLPTEAEWEYACRAGTATPFYFGKTLTDEIANYDASYTYADGPEGQNRAETTDVNFIGIANAFGLSDMHGNVWEWCQDHWHDNYKGAPIDGSAWLSENENASRILRGGSWGNDPRHCRSALHNSSYPAYRINVIGFRVSCASPRALS